MEKRKNIKVEIPVGWSDYAQNNPDGPATFIRDINNAHSVFQVSFAQYKDGEIPNPSQEDLVELAQNTGIDMLLGDMIDTSSGTCSFGAFGTAIFKSKENPHSQIWYLSDGHDFILATYICVEIPDNNELIEVQEIINRLYVSKKSFWKRH